LGIYSIANLFLKCMLFILLSPIYIPRSISYKYSWYIYYLVIIRHEEFDKMPPKVVVLLLAAMISRQGDTSIVESLNVNL